MDSKIRLYLFFDNDYPLVLPSPYDEIEPEKHCACLTVCEDMEEVNSELVVAGNVLEQVHGFENQALSIL